MEQKPGFLQRLQKVWKLHSIKQTILVLLTFVCGGSLCGYMGKQILNLLPIENAVFKTVAYVVVMTIVWPFCVLGVSILFGQYSFFRTYIRKIGRKMIGKK